MSPNGKLGDPRWRENPRWKGVTRPYSVHDVERLRGSIQVEHTLRG
jgi:isocitrate lyase